jgi:hypothetical protein
MFLKKIEDLVTPQVKVGGFTNFTCEKMPAVQDK